MAKRRRGRGEGSIYQCYHGDHPVPQTILEWEPFERMIVREVAQVAPSVSTVNEYRVETTRSGTKLPSRKSGVTEA